MPTTSIPTLSPEELHYTYVTIQAYAGSFYKALGNAMINADPSNLQTLLASFPTLLGLYGPGSSFYDQTRDRVATLAKERPAGS